MYKCIYVRYIYRKYTQNIDHIVQIFSLNFDGNRDDCTSKSILLSSRCEIASKISSITIDAVAESMRRSSSRLSDGSHETHRTSRWCSRQPENKGKKSAPQVYLSFNERAKRVCHWPTRLINRRLSIIDKRVELEERQGRKGGRALGLLRVAGKEMW